MAIPDSPDYIIVGGGTAGCILANRLATNAALSVCLIEAGADYQSHLLTTPGAFGLVVGQPSFNYMYESEPEPHCQGRVIGTPLGKVLGGGSAINAMVHARGQAHDFDHWATLGNKGWGYSDVLPYIMKSEGKTKPQPNGFVKTSKPGKASFDISELFLQTAEKIGWPKNPDFNHDDNENYGVGSFEQATYQGQRSSAANSFIEPIAMQSNFRLLTNANVEKILIEEKRAKGVIYHHNGSRETLIATRGVILCGGAINNPKLLMLSGIGPSDALTKHGINVVHELNGVGSNLQEHPDYSIVVAGKKHKGAHFSLANILQNIVHGFKYWRSKTGPLSRGLAEVGGFIKSSPELKHADIQLHFMPFQLPANGVNMKQMMQRGFTCRISLLKPESRGHISLASNNINDPPKITYNLLQQDTDIKRLLNGIKQVREIFNHPDFSHYKIAEVSPGESIQTDHELEHAIRQEVSIIYHPVGSCKMGHDYQAVVDDNLKVHGLEHLTIADASIMPVTVSGNTNSTTMAIAEKAADRILTELAANPL
jgi:choline dehydrogenase